MSLTQWSSTSRETAGSSPTTAPCPSLDRHKVAGALLECAMAGTAVDFLIIGVGVNVNVELADLRAARRRSAVPRRRCGAGCGRPSGMRAADPG